VVIAPSWPLRQLAGAPEDAALNEDDVVVAINEVELAPAKDVEGAALIDDEVLKAAVEVVLAAEFTELDAAVLAVLEELVENEAPGSNIAPITLL
jgi:hypothetical protein